MGNISKTFKDIMGTISDKLPIDDELEFLFDGLYRDLKSINDKINDLRSAVYERLCTQESRVPITESEEIEKIQWDAQALKAFQYEYGLLDKELGIMLVVHHTSLSKWRSRKLIPKKYHHRLDVLKARCEAIAKSQRTSNSIPATWSVGKILQRRFEARLS